MKVSLVLPCLALLFSALSAGSVAAQTRYTCRTSSGGVSFSDTPCFGTLVASPTADRPSTSNPGPRPGEAQEHLQYLSPRCSVLSEGIRTSTARGVKYDVISELNKNYQRECAEEDRAARGKVSAERREQTKAKEAANKQALASAEKSELHMQQCGEMKRILYTKRQRTNLTEGEKTELQRFEQNFLERCQ